MVKITIYNDGKLDVRRTAYNRLAIYVRYTLPFHVAYIRYVLNYHKIPDLSD